jgi:hypothetical protein
LTFLVLGSVRLIRKPLLVLSILPIGLSDLLLLVTKASVLLFLEYSIKISSIIISGIFLKAVQAVFYISTCFWIRELLFSSIKVVWPVVILITVIATKLEILLLLLKLPRIWQIALFNPAIDNILPGFLICFVFINSSIKAVVVV